MKIIDKDETEIYKSKAQGVKCSFCGKLNLYGLSDSKMITFFGKGNTIICENCIKELAEELKK